MMDAVGLLVVYILSGIACGMAAVFFLIWIISIAISRGIERSRSMLLELLREAAEEPDTTASEKIKDDSKYCPNCGAKRPRFKGALDEMKCANCGYRFSSTPARAPAESRQNQPAAPPA